MKRCRIIYNQDCTNLFSIIKEPIKPGHVVSMIDEIAEGGADLILINPNAQKTNYRSKVWENFWECNYQDMPHSFRQMKHLAEQGYDYLKLTLDRCREKAVASGISIRMNDMHGALEPDTHIMNSSFYKQHPEYRLPGSAKDGWGRIGFNYEYKQVRSHYLRLIGEIVEDYNFDVLELDFLRFPNYFPPGDCERHCNIMTEFLKQVKTITERKKIDLYIRVASMPAAAYELGFDLKVLAEKNIVDGIIFSEFLNTGWEMPVDRFRAIVGDDVALYAGADVSADRRPGLPVRYMPYNELLLYGFAYAYLNSGADGIYFFNFFTLKEQGKDTGKLRFDAFKKIKSVRNLRGCSKTYLITSNAGPCAETDLPHQIPVTVGPRQSKSFNMLAGKEPDSCRFLFRVIFTGDIFSEQLWLRCNLSSAGCTKLLNNVPAQHLSSELVNSKKVSGNKTLKQAHVAEFLIPNNAVYNGKNEFILRNESANEITVHGIELYVLTTNRGGK